MTTKPKRFEGRTWKDSEGSNSLVLEPTNANDTKAVLWIAAPTDGAGLSLTPQQMREAAVELVHRADLLDPPERSPFPEVPATPGEIIARFLHIAKANTDKIWSADEKELIRRAERITQAFTTVALMAELENLAPGRAAQVAEHLAEAWDAGDSIDDWLWEWQQDHKAGKPIGFNPPATLGVEVARD